jgi:hypothetical protein
MRTKPSPTFANLSSLTPLSSTKELADIDQFNGWITSVARRIVAAASMLADFATRNRFDPGSTHRNSGTLVSDGDHFIEPFLF